jgi:ribonuclease P protein subunit POP4
MTKDKFGRELIGCAIEVVKAENNSLVGLKGKVVDETKDTLLIADGKKKKRLLKKQITFIAEIKNKRIEIDGKKINKRPEKRA